MPIACDPKHRSRFVLATDRNKPEDKQPAFYFRGMSIRQATAFAEKVDGVTKKDTGKEAMAELGNLVRKVLVAWEKMTDPETGKKLPYDPKRLEDIVTYDELWELALGAISPQAVQAADLKNLESQSPSSTGGSAKTAGAKKAGGSARTA